MTNNKHHEPLFTIFNKTERSKPKSIILRVSMILITFILSMVIVSIVIKENIFSILKTFYQGATIRPWKLALDSCLLLGFGVAVVPAFKMKYWNMGSNGQVMMGTLVSIIIMFYLGPVALKSKLNNTSGFFRVYKKKSNTCKQRFIWSYQYRENGKLKSIQSTKIDKLKEKVLNKGLEWIDFNE